MLKRPADRPDGGQARARWAAASRRARAVVARPADVRLARPAVSFTFDSFAKSAVRHGAGLLERVGGRGTFYASAAFAAQTTQYGAMFDADDVARLLAAGHEIGCGGFSQPDPTLVSADEIFADMVRNAEALAGLGLPDRLVSFAYPFGAATTDLKRALPTRFTTARTIEPGMMHGRTDLAQLPANALCGADAQPRALRLLEHARRRSGWVIFHVHDVGMRPTAWGAATATLERVILAAHASGMEIAPVRDVAARILAAEACD